MAMIVTLPGRRLISLFMKSTAPLLCKAELVKPFAQRVWSIGWGFPGSPA
jgi:hypothetical protein